MRGHPGASVAELAAIAGCGKSRALWRLHALAVRGAIEKDGAGHWRVKGEEPRSAGEKARAEIKAAQAMAPILIAAQNSGE